MDKTITNQLEAVGLSEKEAVTYLMLLSIGEASVNEIAKASKLERSTTYVLLNSLAQKGFVKSRGGSDTLRYSALEPTKLVEAAEKAVEEAETATETIRAVTEQLERGQAEAANAPYATYFDTQEGLETLRHEVAQLKGGVVVRALLHSLPSAGELAERPDNRIVVAYDESIKMVTDNSSTLRLIPKNSYPFASDFFIFDDTLILISKDEEFAVRIKSREYAEVMSEAFDLAWEEAGRLDADLREQAPKKGARRGR